MSEQAVALSAPDPTRILLAFRKGTAVPDMPVEDRDLARRWIQWGAERAGVVVAPDRNSASLRRVG